MHALHKPHSTTSITTKPLRGDDSTVSSWPTSPRAGLDQPACCRHLTLRTYLGVSLLLGFIFFVWACGACNACEAYKYSWTRQLTNLIIAPRPTAIGFVWGAFLGLIAQGLYLYYIFRLVKRPQPPPDPKTAKRQKVRRIHAQPQRFGLMYITFLTRPSSSSNPSRCST